MNEAVITLDVREHFNSGREPFPAIMQAVSSLNPTQKLLLIAPFEPFPLYQLLTQQGYTFESSQDEEGSWRILFSPAIAAT